jgi:serine/threonine protein kinase
VEPRRRFRIMKELSEGAFGKVYMAEMITGDNFKSVVAIKLLHGKWVSHEEIVQRSRDEARVLGLLHHRNIVRVEDLTSINGQCAVIMEYLEGVDLKHLIRHCREHEVHMPRRVIFEIIASSSSALDAAYHQKTLHGGEPLRVIHRDIKPSNVMVTVNGEIKVLDFGTARAQFEHREAETQALAFGSAAYMAPERVMGDPDTPAGDILSLGITMFELLALKSFGKIYVRKEKYESALTERISNVDLSDLDADRAGQVQAALRLMMAYNPEDRPKAGQVVELMEALAEEVNDGSVRRFCREVVMPCHANMEYPTNPNDPLSGSTLFEDTTRVRSESDDEVSGLTGLGVGPAPDKALPALQPTPPPVDSAPTVEYKVGDEVLSDVLPTLSNDPLGAPPLRDDTPDPRDAPPIEQISVSDALPEPPTDIDVPRPKPPPVAPATESALRARTGSIAKSDGRAWGAVAIVGGVLLIVMAAIVAGVVTIMAPGRDRGTLRELPAGPTYSSGGTIDAARAEGQGGALSFSLEGGDGAKVVISSNQTDFSFRWDGSGGLEITDLEPGTYRIVIRGPAGTGFLQARVRAFQTCTFVYNLSVGGDSWASRGCQ